MAGYTVDHGRAHILYPLFGMVLVPLLCVHSPVEATHYLYQSQSPGKPDEAQHAGETQNPEGRDNKRNNGDHIFFEVVRSLGGKGKLEKKIKDEYAPDNKSECFQHRAALKDQLNDEESQPDEAKCDHGNFEEAFKTLQKLIARGFVLVLCHCRFEKEQNYAAREPHGKRLQTAFEEIPDFMLNSDGALNLERVALSNRYNQ